MSMQPIVELHVHLEGTLQPALAAAVARRNGVPFEVPRADPPGTAESWSTFLPPYLDRIAVLRTAEDFHDAAKAYFDRIGGVGLRHAEFFIDPQRHFDHGVAPAAIFEGLDSARAEAAAKWELTSAVIVCCVRDRGAAAAQHALDLLLPYAGSFTGVGLDSFEPGFPPSRFREVFARARAEGMHLVAHAGAASSPACIWEALDVLGVDRLAHGSRMLDDPILVARARETGIPITVCPLSDRLGDDRPSTHDPRSVLAEHILPVMLDEGLNVSIHSGDPVMHGAFLDEVFAIVPATMGLSDAAMTVLARNSIDSSFADESRKRALHTILDTRLTKEEVLA